MIDLVRDAPIGGLIRHIFGKTTLPFPDEKDDFKVAQLFSATPPPASRNASTNDVNATTPAASQNNSTNDVCSRDVVEEKADASAAGESTVGWYDDTDPENPQNYSMRKKCFIQLQICFFTWTVYSSAAILAPAEAYFREEWGATEQTTLLVLSMPLLGFAIGPLFFSPLSEIPRVGRSGPYLVSLSLFICLTIAGATVKNFPGLVVIRLLQGILASPVVATGAASSGDIFDLRKLPYALSSWGLFAFAGPGLVPLMSGWALESSWRWGMYETLLAGGICWILMVLCFPETNPETILLQRAHRLRVLTGRADLRSQSELSQQGRHFVALIGLYLTKPFRITLLDPSIAFINFYTALLYGIFYTFFESFPLVYGETYGFSLGLTSTAFTSLVVGSTISLTIYCLLVYYIYEPYTAANGVGSPEYRLFPGIFASALAPVGVFIFAWTARADIHWIVPSIGSLLLSGSCAMLYMLIFLYLPLSYPRHAASLFAANTFLRSAFTAGAIHFAAPLFRGLGVARGNTLLGALLVACMAAFIVLWRYGSALRARSQFAEDY